MQRNEQNKDLEIVLAAPRGFCAGVDRAIQIVEQAIRKFGAPVYVRHEIVHNRYVVERLEALGAIFVEELDEVPTESPVIFSAHGVPKSVPAEAKRREMTFVDATCPLVSKVHIDAERHYERGHHVLLIGHAGHPEVLGTMGQLPDGSMTLVETVEDVQNITPPSKQLAYVTQTTLSVDDTQEIVDALRQRFPDIQEPHKDDICYATTNRQKAVHELANQVDAIIVVGAPNSSNSLRLVEKAKMSGCPHAILVQTVNDLPSDFSEKFSKIGITAGASAPEILIEQIIEKLSDNRHAHIREHVVAREDVIFKLPRLLRETH